MHFSTPRYRLSRKTQQKGNDLQGRDTDTLNIFNKVLEGYHTVKLPIPLNLDLVTKSLQHRPFGRHGHGDRSACELRCSMGSPSDAVHIRLYLLDSHYPLSALSWALRNSTTSVDMH